MKLESVLRRAASGIIACAVLAALGTLAACGSAPAAPTEPALAPVTSNAQAEQQLAAVARERAAIEARFAERERVCYDKFFATRCLDQARERRRSALAVQRAIEVQADRFQRQAVVDERDRQLAEAEKRYQEQAARLAAEPPKPAPTVAPEAAPRQPSAPARIAQHNARLEAAQAQDVRDAGKRAQNVREFEARKADVLERQRRVAQRKADKAAKDAKDAKDAAAKAKAAQDAAQPKPAR